MDTTTKKILDYVKQYNEKEGVGPSLEEIAAHVGMSKQGATWRINRMIAGGLLTRGSQHRSLRVVSK